MKKYMMKALKEAEKAYNMGEVPVGAVIVKDGEVIAGGHNLTETQKDPTCHAEMMAIRQAATLLGGWRLSGCDMYVTLEPCAMCAGAIVWSRIDNLYIGAKDPKSGACGSIFQIPTEDRLNHQVRVNYGLMEEECSKILKDFFAELRKKKK